MKKAQLKPLLEKHFDISVVSCTQLNGYDNKNFLVKSTEDKKYIIKTYRDLSLELLLEEESKILSTLHLSLDLPQPIKSTKGKWVESVSTEDEEFLIRVLSYVEGEFLADVVPTEKLAESIGSKIALLSIELTGLQSSTIQKRRWDWHLNATYELRKKITLIDKAEIRRVVSYFIHCFEQFVKTLQDQLLNGILQMISMNTIFWLREIS